MKKALKLRLYRNPMNSPPPSKQHILKVTDEEGRSIEQVTFDDRKPDTEIREQAGRPSAAGTPGRILCAAHGDLWPVNVRGTTFRMFLKKRTHGCPLPKSFRRHCLRVRKLQKKRMLIWRYLIVRKEWTILPRRKKPSRIATWVSDQHQIQRLVHLYRGLNIREQRIIAIGIVFFSCLFLYTFILDPLFEKNKLLKYQIEKKNQELSEMIHLRSSVVQDQDGMDRIKSVIDQRGQGFSVFAYLEQLATRAEMKDKIMYIKPQRETPVGPFRESLAEIRLDNINLEELTRFLYEIEASEGPPLYQKFEDEDF